MTYVVEYSFCMMKGRNTPNGYDISNKFVMYENTVQNEYMTNTIAIKHPSMPLEDQRAVISLSWNNQIIIHHLGPIQ